MKKLINSPDTVVTDALAGLAAAHPSLAVDIENKVITRAGGPTAGKVGLVSGGGAGHEPLHGGFVGFGMLDAACPGEVFTSPVPDQMLVATKAVSSGAGVLHVVKNYTGDVLNFQMAAELAADEGIEVAPVLVNDDIAVQDSLYTAGRRGTGATVFVEKIAGALAERAAPLSEVAAVAAEVNERSRSFGVALTSCTVPAAGVPWFVTLFGRDSLVVSMQGISGFPEFAVGALRRPGAVRLDLERALRRLERRGEELRRLRRQLRGVEQDVGRTRGGRFPAATTAGKGRAGERNEDRAAHAVRLTARRYPSAR